ncbi:MAG: transglycosylase family protein [Propionibacteriaceae bacterium]|nr:transglycosylase family protein [Propionibacteriaceae bacterium]
MLKRIISAAAAALVGLGLAVVAPQAANAAETDQYTTPGHHLVNDRYWKTECEMYSTHIVRCTTQIWGDKVVQVNGRSVNHEGWVFNNLTYLPSDREGWGENPLVAEYGQSHTWKTADGREWLTECDTENTGRNGCRSYVKQGADWVFNNIVQFTAGSNPAVTSVPAAAPALAGVPVETKPAVSRLDLSREAQWNKIARCESGNRWNINTGNGYYGGLQFNLATWRSVRGQDFAAYPHQATREEQITVANRLHAKRGFQPWGCKP